MALDFSSFMSQQKESQIQQKDNEILTSNNGDIEKWEEQQELMNNNFRGNIILYDDDKEDRFNAVVKLVTKHSLQAENEKTEFEQKLQTENNEEKKNDDEYSTTVVAECLYVLMQVAAADKQVDRTMFKMSLTNRGIEITNKLIPLRKQIVAYLFEESHLCITLSKIIIFNKKEPNLTEKSIPELCADQIWMDPNYLNNIQVEENFVEKAQEYSLVGFMKTKVTDARFQYVDQQAAKAYLKLCINEKGVELFGAVKYLLLKLHNSLLLLKLHNSIILKSSETQKKWVKSSLKTKWSQADWCLTSVFKNEGAPPKLSKQSINILHTHFMSYMQPFIDAKLN